MRKLLLAAAGAVAMATASMAGAAVTVSGATGLNSPNPNGVYGNADGSAFFTFGQTNPLTDPFSGSFNFSNSLGGVYNIVLSTSTSGVAFSNAYVLGGVCVLTTDCALSPFPDAQNLRLNGLNLLANTVYSFHFTGSNSVAPGGALTGNFSITPAPEPATWGMMLIGFAGIGLAMRRGRRRSLAQLA